MAWVIYDAAKLSQFTGSPAAVVNYATGGDTIKVMLATATYVPDQAAHQFKSSVTNEVAFGSGNYTAGGVTLASKTATVTAHVLTFDSADLTWLQHATGFTTARIAVCYKSTGVDATSLLIAYYDLASDRGNVAGDLVLGIPGIWGL
jgi:hypothetical protein